MSEPLPLLLHFDINKTVVQSDSIQLKTIEDGVREGISELFWGYVRKSKEGDLTWDWMEGKPSSDMPQVEPEEGVRIMSYSMFCKEVIKDKTLRKQAMKSFDMVNPPKAKEEMEVMLAEALEKMLMPPELCFTKEAMQAGLRGTTVVMIPALFHFVANLQLSKRTFAIVFRSFGGDHDQIAMEWNKFCEMKHPVFSHLLQECGPMDGTVPGVPDRRVHGIHTLYRDAAGPLLMLDTFTNGPSDQTWDKWVKQKPKPKADGRNGREYAQNVLKCQTIEGSTELAKWLKSNLLAQKSAAIKDDWAWWTFHGESQDSGKLLLLMDAEGKDETRQIFYDDNVEHDSTRIVDCRNPDGSAVPQNLALDKLCTKVNSVEALLNNSYFLDKLCKCHNEHSQAQASIEHYERQLAEVRRGKLEAERQMEAMKKEMQGMVEENRRMKLLRKIKVDSKEKLQELLTEAGIAEKFGQDGFKTVEDFWKELEEGCCWLEHDDDKNLVRVMEMCFLKIKFKDRILIESHEQSGDRIQQRNYLAGARKKLTDQTFKEAIDRFFESGLPIDIRSLVTNENLPVFVPDAPEQVTGATQAFPIKCKLQQSEATYVIKEKTIEGREDVNDLGLPNGKHFTTLEANENEGSSITHFWRWDKMASWEAMSSRMAKKGASTQVIDISLVCDKLFRGHPRREVYENLLLQMFETFTAKKLCGGFSGSLVIRVQPYETGGKMGDPCIVKMDAGEAIREEYINSVAVFDALPDRAARILGDAVYAKNKEMEEFGAMRLELAGACWNVPELAQGGGTLLSTFKDLLVYESEQTMLGKNDTTDGVGRPFGNTNSILAESFGPGGIVASLRKGGDGLNRHKKTNLLWGWYTLKGKVSKYNPYSATPEEYPPGPAMKRMYKKYFGHEMPDLKALVVDKIKPMLIEMSDTSPVDMFPLVGLAHGDLNAANIMIDAMDAVWLIDFATSVELPLFTDMCKFEMASLFEYAAIPITPELLVEFASTNRKIWDKINVGDWLRVDQDVAVILLNELIELGPERLAAMNQPLLEKIIEETAAKTGKAPHKQVGIIRGLKSRLVANEALMDCAFSYCALCSPALLSGDFLTDALYMKQPPLPTSHAIAGSASLRFFMDVACSVRRLMAQDIMNLLRSQASNLLPVDGMCLQLWLPFLRESYRIIGYRDISPQAKIWSMYHCKIVSELVLNTLETLKKHWTCLNELPVVIKMTEAIRQSEKGNDLRADDKSKKDRTFREVESLWFYTNRHLFPSSIQVANMVRKVHARDALNRDKPGLFAPILEVHYDGMPQLLCFDEQVSADAKAPDLWSLYVAGDEAEIDKNSLIGTMHAWVEESGGPLTAGRLMMSSQVTPVREFTAESAIQSATLSATTSAAPSPQTDSDDFIGTPSSLELGGYSHKIDLKSRLLSLSPELITKHQNKVMIGVPLARDNFSVGQWSGGMIVESGGRREPQKERRARRGSMGNAQQLDLHQFLHLDCIAIHPDGKSRLEIKLVLGTPICCYPPGSKLCCEQAHLPPGMPWFPRMVVWSLSETGQYQLRDVENPEKENDHEFHPQPFNHVYCDQADYQVGQRVIFVKNHMSFLDGTILETPQKETGWRYSLQLNEEDPAPNEDRGKEVVLRHLDVMNSSLMDVPSDAFEDELTKVRSNVKARHSFIIDALSGMRLEVKECAMPTLIVTSPNLAPPPQANEGALQAPPKGGSRPNRVTSLVASKPGVNDDIVDVEQKAPDKKAGWQNIMIAVDRYDKREPSCGPNAFLVIGLPGSGKTSLITRAIVDCLEKQRNFVPVLVPVNDLLKKIAQAGDSFDMNKSQPSVFFDMYLRTVFGEDSQRYKTIIQAKLMHRVMFLFQGLDGAGAVGPFIEKMITELILERHLILITARPFLEGAFSLQTMHSYVSAMQIGKFNDEQKHWVAQVRLGADGLKAYEKFVKQLKDSQVPSEGTEEDGKGEGEEQDVFGNPMMLSMLLVYLLVRQKKKAESEAEGKHQEGDDVITQSAVYRVAIDVMLAQAQSKAQAERHNKEEKMEQCKRVLERIAMEMQIRKTQELDADDVSKFTASDLQDTWNSLRGAVAAGHAMFLRMADGNNLRFFVKGFQSYFSAGQVVQDKGKNLPPLELLLTDSWWKEMLEMLADSNSHTFVSFIEDSCKQFVPKNGWSFLHVAASVGHRPIFQHFEYFQESTRNALWSKNENLFTPLHVAAEKGNTQLCRLMIDHKALMDVEDKFGCLPMHVAMQNGHFSTGKYLLDRWISHYGSARRGDVKSHAAQDIAQRILDKQISEADFTTACQAEFVELRFYVKQFAAEGQRSLGALLSTYWVCGDHYDMFVRAQQANTATMLTPGSWKKLQSWASEDVQLTRDAEIVGAMLQFLSIINVGKISPFRKTFAPGYDDAAESLAHVLRHYPILMPSFSRLSDDMQQMILFSTRADFNFGQFLQAENLPANLGIVKGILSEGAGKNNVFGFFLFRIFAAMCGLRGDKTLEGSMFMIDPLFQTFKLGLDVLNHLKDESAQDVCVRFLGKKAEVLQMPLKASDPQSKALVRICILFRVMKPEGVSPIAEAWRQLDPDTLSGLVKYLNTDGITQKPGFLLFNCPNFMDNAVKNPAIGAARAMRMLLRVYQAATKEYADSKKEVLTVYVNEMADWAKGATDGDVFDFTRFAVERTSGPKSEVLASVVISPWKLVNDQEEIQEQREQLVHKLQSGSLKEAAFIRRLEDCFPELGFFVFSHDTATLRQTKCALLSIYWMCTDQAEAFTRGHHPDEKLTDATWATLVEPMEQNLEQVEVMEAMLVAVAIMNLGKIKKFQEQLAPEIEGHREVLNHVMDVCPKVLPSYYCLQAPYNKLVRTALTANFNFLHFLNAENVAFNLTYLKEMMAHARKEGSLGELVPWFYIITNFAEIAGCKGDEGLDGSLYMTEARFSLFKISIDAIRMVFEQDVVSITDIYIEFLEQRAHALSIPFDKLNAQTHCVTRIASLCKCFKKSEGQSVVEAFNQLTEDERSLLTKYMTADGIKRKPAFVLVDSPGFLEAAISNKEVGLVAALRCLIRICGKAESRVSGNPLQHTSIIDIYFARLTRFTREFLGSVAFDDVPFELKTFKSGVLIAPKAWIPVNNEGVLESLNEKAREMCTGLLEDKYSEPHFVSIMGRIYPELSYFTNQTAMLRGQTHGAMLSIFWIITGNHDAFTRQQPEDEQISSTSWAWLQEWAVHNVKLTSPEAVDAIMVFMAIHALGKIQEFREELAPSLSETHHDVVLAAVLRNSPEVVPSFLRLKDEYRDLIADSLSVDFQFYQFLQAENVPANLRSVQDVLARYGEDGFAFYCFRIFVTMCGRLGWRSLEGSLFMTENQFQRFRPGLEALERLRKLDACSAYKTFLLQRASKTLVRFASSEHHAIARLLCLCSAFDHDAGNTVCDAFWKLSQSDKSALIAWLCSDGMESSPGYVLDEASNLIAQAQTNQAVGLISALRMLARIQSVCERVVRHSSREHHEKVIVQMEDVVLWAKECGPDPAEFNEAQVSLRQIEVKDERSDAMVLRVEVMKPCANGTFRPEVRATGTNGTSRPSIQTEITSPVSSTCRSPLGVVQQSGLAFKPPSRTRRLAQILRAQRKRAAGGEEADAIPGIVTRL